MFRPPRTSHRLNAAALLGTLLIPCAATGQTLSLQVAEVDPVGLGGIIPTSEILDFGMEDGIKGDLSYGVGLASTYDSNFFQTDGKTESELSSSLTPWVNYRSDPEGGARVALTATYTPSARAYANNSDLNDVDQSGSVSLTVTGSKTLISLYARYNELAGTDRLTGSFIDGSILNSGIQASYQVAPRTNIYGGVTAAISQYDSSGLEGAEIYTTQFGGLWDATGRFSVGPSVRYSQTSSENTGDQDAWALLVNARYKVGEKILIFGTLGVEYSKGSRDDGDSGLGLTGSLAAQYPLTERIFWSNSIIYATVPSATDTNLLVRNVAVSTALTRELTRGSVDAGLDLNFSSYDEVGAVATERGSEQNFGAFVSYRRNLFLDRVGFESKVRYALNDGEVDWSQIQVSAGLQVSF